MQALHLPVLARSWYPGNPGPPDVPPLCGTSLFEFLLLLVWLQDCLSLAQSRAGCATGAESVGFGQAKWHLGVPKGRIAATCFLQGSRRSLASFLKSQRLQRGRVNIRCYRQAAECFGILASPGLRFVPVPAYCRARCW